MAFKCEICKKRDAKRQYIGAVSYNAPEKELYVCNECYTKLTPALTWESLKPLLTHQLLSLESADPRLLNSVTTTLAIAVLKSYHKLNAQRKTIPDLLDRGASVMMLVAGEKASRDEIHTLTFLKPNINGSIKTFHFIFDDDLIDVFMSLDPHNEKELTNIIALKTKKHFPPAFGYLGLGIDAGYSDPVSFFHCLIRAVDLVDGFADVKSLPKTSRAATERLQALKSIIDNHILPELESNGEKKEKLAKKASTAANKNKKRKTTKKDPDDSSIKEKENNKKPMKKKSSSSPSKPASKTKNENKKTKKNKTDKGE